jgi:fatty acid desaturase
VNRKTDLELFAHSGWDIVPVLAALAQFAFLLGMVWIFPAASWWVMAILGGIYAVSISWNINGISHNFLHNPYFKSHVLNRLFSLLESLTIGFSQTFYECVHQRHHMGNSDRKNEAGETIDWLSIYRHGENDEPENIWSYVFLGYFRDDPKAIYREIHRKNKDDAFWGVFEIATFLAFYIIGFIWNWKFMLFFLPFYYLGHCLSYLNGYYLHYGGNPDVPIAWGVSSYHRLYNWLWFNNGYHAEHHFRPKVHWTQMKTLHVKIQEEQRKAGVRVIVPPHALGFLEKTKPVKATQSRPALARGETWAAASTT